MNKETFIIIFSDGEQIKKTAWSLEEAKILAQAERIEKGESYQVTDWKIYESYNHYGSCEGDCDTCSRQHVCLD